MSEKRFVACAITVEEYVQSTENRNTRAKTKRDVELFEKFLRMKKNKEKAVHTIGPAELNKCLVRLVALLEVKMKKVKS